MKHVILSLAAALIAGAIACAGPASAAEDVVIVYDASGSMWGQIEGTSKIEIAREVMADLVDDWDAETNLGLVAYGHRQEGDCTDIETMIAPGPVDRTRFIESVNAIRPLGKTPISASVQHAADLLAYRDKPATVVLISDGVETCNADPCALSDQLAQQGVQFTVHVVGFDLEDAENASLSCIADNTGGVFVPAGNAAELHDALDEVQSVLDLKPVTPQPEPEPVLPEVTLTGPEQVTTGAAFDFSWSGAINVRDFITIVPAGADDGTANEYIRVGDESESRLTAPGTTGLYELRYVLEEGRRTLASVSIEVVEGEVGLTGPEQVTTGAAFDFSWSGAINVRDFITIVPAGADDGTANEYIRVGDESESRLTAPGTTGLYELRYVLEEGRRTLASVSIEVVEGEVGLTGPEQVTTGAAFDFSWSGAINVRDFITIVPAGADDGTANEYIRVGDESEGRLTAPGTTGLYELRYVLEEGRRTLASVSIEVVEGEVGLTGPEQVTTGAAFDFSWSGAINVRDFITIVLAGADDGTANEYIRVGDESESRLTAPGTTGLYELRYVLEEGRRTLASVSIEVVEGEVGLTGPEQVTTGAAFDFSWSGAINVRDFITIVPAGADDGTANEYIRVGDESEGRLTAPGTTGLYELRYVLEEGRRTLASVSIEVVEGEVGLTGPEQVTTGAAFDFSWSGAINVRDFITIVLAGADDGTANEYIRVGDESESRLTAPGTTGLYELRYVLEEGRRTLASVSIEVVEGEVGLTGPEQVTTGAAFDFSWSGAINVRDFITIVPAGADDGTANEYIRVGDESEGRLTAPGTTGLYELRYVLEEGRRTLASVSIEVVEGEVGLTGPATVRAGTDADVQWSGTINVRDFITIVPAGADDGTVNDYIRVGDESEGRLTAPGTTGLYELRYVLEEGRRTLASAPLEVVGADAPLDDGAGLSVPETAAPGKTIPISWTGESDSADQRIAIARKDQADFSWISVKSIGAEKTMELEMPDEPGLYEVRFLDLAGQQVLGRVVIEVR